MVSTLVDTLYSSTVDGRDAARRGRGAEMGDEFVVSLAPDPMPPGGRGGRGGRGGCGGGGRGGRGQGQKQAKQKKQTPKQQQKPQQQPQQNQQGGRQQNRQQGRPQNRQQKESTAAVEDDGAPVPPELQRRIAKQIEFYFSDSNLVSPDPLQASYTFPCSRPYP